MKAIQKPGLLITLIILLYSFKTSNAQSWSDLQLELVSADTLYVPYMGKKPEGKVRIIHTGSNPICDVSLSQCNAVSSIGVSVNPFPNVGQMDILPGDTTWMKCWLEHSDGIAVGTYDWTMNYVLNSPSLGILTYSVPMVTIKNSTGFGTTTGSVTVSGNIYYPSGGTPSSIGVQLCTQTMKAVNGITVTPNANGASFSANIPGFLETMKWYVKVTCNGYEGVHKYIEPDSANNIQITLTQKSYANSPNLVLVDTIHTEHGFWRGTASESEQTIALFPGQENWLGNSSTCQQDSVQKLTSKVYKIGFDGSIIWTHATGWEAWAGDMTDDGSLVAYCIEPYNVSGCEEPNSKLAVLDGSTGNEIWSLSGHLMYEYKEIRFSHNGQYLAAGNTGSGVLFLYNALTGSLVWTINNTCDQFGQVRRIIFDSTDTYMYVSSGDSYVRKISVANGTVIWSAYCGSWGWVDGFNLSPDETKLVNGGKCGDVFVFDTQTGKELWHTSIANFTDAVFSPDGSKICTYTGQIFDTNTGEMLGYTNTVGMPHWYDNDRVFSLPNSVYLYEYTGKDLFNTNTAVQSGLGLNAGENTQWAHYSPATGYIIIAARDMLAPPQSGIAIYRDLNAATGIKNEIKNSGLIKLKPNPSNGSNIEMNVTAKNISNSTTITIIDIFGKLVYEGNYAQFNNSANFNTTLDLDHLSSGVYTLCLKVDNSVSTERIIITE